jgi:hypothetical protein
MTVTIDQYLDLMRAALSGRLTLKEFAGKYMMTFSDDETMRGDETYQILNGVFLDSDEYVPRSDPRYEELKAKFPEFTIDDQEFLSRIADALNRLSNLRPDAE